MDDCPIGLDIFRTAVPMRTFEHAAASRRIAEAVVVRLRTASGRNGWGETLPRQYVTGETLESVADDIERVFWPRLRACQTDGEVQQAVRALPCRHDGRRVAAARCAVELAFAQAFGLADWPAPTAGARTGRPLHRYPTSVTGVLGSADPRRTTRMLRLMRWYGLRHFKLKLGFDDPVDRANLQAVCRRLAPALKQGRCTLRVDVNGAWKYKDVPQRCDELKALGVHAVEQPCPVRPSRFVDLALNCPVPLIADESCLDEGDADVLLGAEGRVWLNVRLSKNGGLAPALAMARQAEADGVPYVLGCMVGESGILSMAQRAFLAVAPPPLMLEGNYGRMLLKDDLTQRSPRFGYGGRLYLPASGRFAPHVRGDKLRRYGQLVRRLD